MRRIAMVVATSMAAAAAPGVASACVTFGVYQPQPERTFVRAQKAVGNRLRTVSVYVTTGGVVPPVVMRQANKRRLRLVVSWLPDVGRDGPNQKGYTLAKIAAGKFDKDLRALGAQLRTLKVTPIVRPMPEPNTTWYAWSGTVNGNTPAKYKAAWRHVRAVLRKSAGRRTKLLWSVYARSVPDEQKGNTLEAYFPGAKYVNYVGVSDYNFGTDGDLSWTDPADLFGPAYARITKLAKKPFWIAETASTSRGGSKQAWIAGLKAMRTQMPRLGGIIWFDSRDREGDFRIRETKATTAAFRALVKGGCR